MIKADIFLESLTSKRFYDYEALRKKWKTLFENYVGINTAIKNLYKKKKLFCYDENGKHIPFCFNYYFSVTKLKNKDKRSAKVDKISKQLLKLTLDETRSRLNDWIDKNLDIQLRKYISEEVEKEFSNEILPILLKKIDVHIKEVFALSKQHVIDTLIEVAQDFITKNKKG